MEQNKVLMIIVSVAIFFAAIVGVGVALLYPRSDADVAAAGAGDVRGFDPIEYVRRPEQAPLTQSEDEDPLIIVYGDSLEGESVDAQDNAEVTTAVESNERTITISPARETAVAESAESGEATESTPAPSTSGSESSRPAGAAESAPAPQAEPRQEPRQIRVTEYWIQLIASPHRDRVEQARGTLADYSLGGRVTTRDVDGELYYRLRVGPYENHDEAEKFLEWIREIDGFTGAYISEEYPLRTVTG